MKYYLPFIGAMFGVMTFLATPATAQTLCGPHTEIAEKLSNQFEERQSAVGLANNGTLLEVFTSKVGSWTILFTRPDGISCLIVTGNSWLETAEPAKAAQQEL
jgi:hypothetical protein